MHLGKRWKKIMITKCMYDLGLQVLTKLSEEVERLISDRYEVQQHLLRMEAWSENLSFWRTHIQSVHYHDENDVLQVRIKLYT